MSDRDGMSWLVERYEALKAVPTKKTRRYASTRLLEEKIPEEITLQMPHYESERIMNPATHKVQGAQLKETGKDPLVLPKGTLVVFYAHPRKVARGVSIATFNFPGGKTLTYKRETNVTP